MSDAGAVARYADRVVDGQEPAGELLTAAARRHLDDVRHGADRGLRWDDQAAAAAIGYFRKLRHYKGEWAGQRVELEPFQQFIVGSLFGWKRDDGLRRFRQAYNEQPRGQGKSTISAGIALRLAFFDNEPGAEVYTVATKRDQARITWDTAARMVRQVPGLRSRISVRASHLYQEGTASKLVPLGADADTLDGLRPNGVIADEIHAHRTSALLDVMSTATGTRRQPLIWEITTAGVGQTGVCWDHHEYSSKVARGIVQDDSWFAAIIGADPDDDWRDPAIWRKANPCLGISVKADDLARKALQAQHIPAFEAEFRRLHLGQWVQQAERYLSMQHWDLEPNRQRVEAADLRGQPCVIGLDIGSKFDFTAAVALFGSEATGYQVLPHFFIPETAMTQAGRALVPLEAWRRQGYLTVTDGNIADQAQLVELLRRWKSQFSVKEVAYDSWNATQLALDLQSEGFPVVEVRQGFRTLSEPTQQLAALTAAGKLRHGGHPVLRWMADNLVVRSDANGNVAPDKAKAAEKIDGIVALIMCLSRAGHLKQAAPSWRERGLVVL